MASNSTSRVIRQRPLEGSFRHYPYATGEFSRKKEVKEEVVRLGVKLSLSVAESMYLLCDDLRTTLSWCLKLCKLPIPGPVHERLLRLVHHVYSEHIQPKNGVYLYGGNSVQFELIKTTWNDFVDGLIVLHRLVMLLQSQNCSFDDRLLSSAVSKYKQVLNNLDDKLSSAKHLSEANGFAAETLESTFSDTWKSLFDEAQVATPSVIPPGMFRDLFQPVVGSSSPTSPPPVVWHREIHSLTIRSCNILRENFAKQELKEEVVRLGVELSLCMAESMFLLSDDIRSMLLFCNKLWRDAIKDLKYGLTPVLQRLLRVMHHVYSKYIRPKNGVYENDGNNSVQWELTSTTWDNFNAGVVDLDLVVSILKGVGSYSDGREFTSSIEESLEKIGDKLSCVKAVSEANGFARDAMESDIMVIWSSLYDKQTQDAWTQVMIGKGIVYDMFYPLVKERESAATTR